jgi:peptidoglycan-associated lipoprotein
MQNIKGQTATALLVFTLAGCSVTHKAPTIVYNVELNNDISALYREFKTIADNKVYFAFDSSKLSTEAKATLFLQAEWLKANKYVVVSIEGHCDEVGTEEYNLSLGLKRGKAVIDALAKYGVEVSRLSVVSYGKSRPEDSRRTKEANKVNRRALTVVIKNKINN